MNKVTINLISKSANTFYDDQGNKTAEGNQMSKS